VRVLAYHRVEPCRDLSWNRVSPRRFERQMELLRREGCRGVSLRERIRSNGGASVAITFDDGLASVVRHALPVLARFGFRATIFVPTGWVGRLNGWDSRLVGRPVRHAGWKELEAAAAEGWEIGSHGHTHRDLTILPEEEARGELAISRALIADRIGTAPAAVAYPFGRMNERVARLAREAGYACGCISFASRGVPDPWRIGRSGVRLFDGDADFLAKVRGGPLESWQAAKDRLAHLFSLGTPRLFHRIRKVDALC
jgi:peptidoglycan/xylan/chitin deacetylase (PgdA/CDA1 family)